MIKTYLKLAALVSALVFLAGCGKKGQIVESCDRELALCETEAFIPDNKGELIV